ncbi:MAG: methyltransferase domain-containing protein, partial [Actinobacteria bacterium]|nr:methyltransferase domain-containing protein [Actinomycetota bacterium]
MDALREGLGLRQPATNGHTRVEEHVPGPARDAPRSRSELLRERVKERARPATDAVLERLAVRVLPRVRTVLEAEMYAELRQLEARIAQLQARVEGYAPVIGSLDEIARANDLLHALGANQELMKAELGAFHRTLDELGRAIAPTAGLEGVPARFSELRERVNATDREVRRLLESEATAASPPRAAAPNAPAPAAPPFRSSGFDYVGFEGRFRGDPAAVLEELGRRYTELLASHQPVVDIGCGRGELLESLATRGIAGIGVEPDAGMAAEARSRGLEVHATGAVEFLTSAEPGSFGAITAIHVAEHLDLETLVAFVELAASRLRPGGVLVIETPNPASLVVLGNSYVMDPTHV